MWRAACLLLLLPSLASAQEPAARGIGGGGAEALRIERLRAMSGLQPRPIPAPFRDQRRIHPNPRHTYPDVYEYVPTRDPLARERPDGREDLRWFERPRWDEYGLDRYRFWDVSERPRVRNAYEVDPERDLDAHHRYRYRNAYRHWLGGSDVGRPAYPYGRFDLPSSRASEPFLPRSR